jgi:hypothetical protein
MVKSLLYISTFVLFGASIGCSDLGSSRYGLVALNVPPAEELYFRREARGLNFDQLSITRNADVCAKTDRSQDIVFVGSNTHPFYKIVGNEVHIYVGIVPEIPLGFGTSTKIIFHEINNGEFLNYREPTLDVDCTFWTFLWIRDSSVVKPLTFVFVV